MIKLIASDMDGTLLNKQMQISSENIAAIKEAQAKGVEFLVATGRAPSESQGILAKAGLHTGFINLNGAMIFNTAGELIVNEPIPKDQSIKINKLLKDSGFYFEIVAADNVYSDSRLRRIANFSDLLVDLNKKLTFKKAVSFAAGSDEIMRIKYVSDFKDLLEKPDFEAMKFVAFHPDGPKVFKHIREEIGKMGDLIVTASSSTNIEINNKKTKKGIEKARLNGKQIGQPKGTKLTTKKSIKAKEDIKKYSKDFNGSLTDVDVMKLIGVARNTYYKYKKEIVEGN